MTEHGHHDDDTIIIKPLAFTGTILLSAGCGLAAGLLICWLMCCGSDDPERQAGLLSQPELSLETDMLVSES